MRTFLVHQYEFGCIGINVDIGGAQWQLARTALAVLWASAMALEQKQIRVREEDVNGDGIDEITVVCGDNAYIFSSRGARLLYWFDLARGVQLVGTRMPPTIWSYTETTTALCPIFGGEGKLGPPTERTR